MQHCALLCLGILMLPAHYKHNIHHIITFRGWLFPLCCYIEAQMWVAYVHRYQDLAFVISLLWCLHQWYHIAHFNQVTIKVETHNLRAFFSVNFAFVPSGCDSMVGDMSYIPHGIVTHFIQFCIIIAFKEQNTPNASLSGFKNILKELLFCHLLSNPETCTINVSWRKETEWNKLFSQWQPIHLKYQ